MAYKTLVSKYCANRAAAHTEIWTMLESMGWTLHDNRDANSYRVYSSNGESGNRITQYIRLDWTTADRIGFIGYYFWNNTNQTGLGAANSANRIDTLQTSESGFYLWLYGNKNLVYIVTKVGTTYYANVFGHVPKTLWTTLSTLTANATSGSNVTLNLQSTEGFVAGRAYQIVGASAEGRDAVTVASITNSTQLVVSSLPRNYNTGSQIGEAPVVFGASLPASLSLGQWYHTCPLNAVGTANATGNEYLNTDRSLTLASGSLLIYFDPDSRGGGRLLVPMLFMEYYSSASQSFLGYCDEYLLYTPTTGLANEDTLGVGQLDSGTATSGGSNTLNDTSKNWDTNIHQNKAVIIAAGLGAGHIRKITSNSATQLVTEGDAWIIDATSSYRIVDEAYRYLVRDVALPYACREGV